MKAELGGEVFVPFQEEEFREAGLGLESWSGMVGRGRNREGEVAMSGVCDGEREGLER